MLNGVNDKKRIGFFFFSQQEKRKGSLKIREKKDLYNLVFIWSISKYSFILRNLWDVRNVDNILSVYWKHFHLNRIVVIFNLQTK